MDHPKYPWSSYYLFKYPYSIQSGFMNINSILDYYSGPIEKKKDKYCHSLNVNVNRKKWGLRFSIFRVISFPSVNLAFKIHY